MLRTQGQGTCVQLRGDFVDSFTDGDSRDFLPQFQAFIYLFLVSCFCLFLFSLFTASFPLFYFYSFYFIFLRYLLQLFYFNCFTCSEWLWSAWLGHRQTAWVEMDGSPWRRSLQCLLTSDRVCSCVLCIMYLHLHICPL